MKLIKPSNVYKDSYLGLVEDFKKDDMDVAPYVILWETSDWPAFIQRLRDMADGYHLKPSLVPAVTYWLIDEDDSVVGVSNIRVRLNPWLIKNGGHIGYGIRPSKRRKGFAKEILKLSLAKCARLGIHDVLLFCSTENVGSRKSILANGGIFDSTTESEDGAMERYWIFQKCVM
jgi:predicted acetyltransferase